MNNRRKLLIALTLANAIAAFCANYAIAADMYPAKTVSIVVPYTAGGPTDTLGRIMADRMTRGLGRQVSRPS